MLEISLDSSRCVFWSSLVLSRILMATLSEGDKNNHHRRLKEALVLVLSSRLDLCLLQVNFR